MPASRSEAEHAPTFYVVCWNDPVNLMVYVTHVFMKVFGWNREKAQKHMMEVHEKGKSERSSGKARKKPNTTSINSTNINFRQPWSRRNEIS